VTGLVLLFTRRLWFGLFAAEIAGAGVLPITTFHGWHLADGVVQQFGVLAANV
jgi:hypothetical protein